MQFSFLSSYFSVLIPLVVLDALWLGVIAKNFYKTNIGYLMGESVVWIPAVFFYLLYAAGLAIFVIEPSQTASQPLFTATWRGAIFGLIAYGTYNLTNHATIKGWPFAMTITDMSWGAFATAGACMIAVFLLRKYVGV